MKKFTYIIFLAATLLVISGRSHPLCAKTIQLDEKLIKIPIGRLMEYLVDKDGSLGIRDVQSGKYTGRWKTSGDDGPGFGFTNDVYWVRFTVENKTDREMEFFIEQGYALIDSIRLYAPDVREFKEIEVGRMKPFKERPFNYRTFVFPLKIKGHSKVTCYLRYQTTSSMNIVLVIWSPEAFSNNLTYLRRLLMLFNGIILILIAYNLFLLFIIRWLEYLFYCLFLGSFLLYMGILNGTAYQYLWPNYPHWGSFFMTVMLTLTMLFLELFCIELVGLRVDRNKARINNILFKSAVCLTVIISIILVSDFFIPYRIAMTIVTSMAGFVEIYILIIGAIMIVKDRNRQAIFGLIAAMPLMIGGMMFILKTFSLVPTNFLIEWAMHIGIVLMAVFFSIVLADKVNNIRKELAALNVSLEEKVADRTGELHSANEKLEAINEDLGEINSYLVKTNADLEVAQDLASLDMKLAERIQRTLLPAEPPEPAGWDIALSFTPIFGVSGDFLEFYTDANRLEGIAIFDVSGHGIASGLITMIARSVFHRNFYKGKNEPLNQMANRSNRDLIKEIGKIDNYLTGIILRFNDNNLEYVNASHPDLIIRKGVSGEIYIPDLQDDDIKGLVLGAEGLDRPYNQMNIAVSSGDILVLYTDGIEESRNDAGELYGHERVINTIREAPDGSASVILDFILNRFRDFVGTSEIKDDMTIVVLKKLQA